MGVSFFTTSDASGLRYTSDAIVTQAVKDSITRDLLEWRGILLLMMNKSWKVGLKFNRSQPKSHSAM